MVVEMTGSKSALAQDLKIWARGHLTSCADFFPRDLHTHTPPSLIPFFLIVVRVLPGQTVRAGSPGPETKADEFIFFPRWNMESTSIFFALPKCYSVVRKSMSSSSTISCTSSVGSLEKETLADPQAWATLHSFTSLTHRFMASLQMSSVISQNTGTRLCCWRPLARPMAR